MINIGVTEVFPNIETDGTSHPSFFPEYDTKLSALQSYEKDKAYTLEFNKVEWTKTDLDPVDGILFCFSMVKDNNGALEWIGEHEISNIKLIGENGEKTIYDSSEHDGQGTDGFELSGKSEDGEYYLPNGTYRVVLTFNQDMEDICFAIRYRTT